MEFRLLTYFLAVVQEKNISKAAKTLHLSQPALSKQLKSLEDELGVQLFQRGNRTITLTEEGYYLAKKSQDILSLVTTTTENLAKKTFINGKIIIGAGESPVIETIAIATKKLLKKQPNITFRLHSGNADDLLEKIDTGVFDFGIVLDPVEKEKYAYKMLPKKDRWGLLMNKKHPLSARSFISPHDLRLEPLLVSSQSLFSDQLGTWLGTNVDQLTIVGSYNLLYNAAIFVQKNIASALCIEGIIQTKQSSLCFVPLFPIVESAAAIIWKKNTVHSKAAIAFLKEIEQLC